MVRTCSHPFSLPPGRRRAMAGFTIIELMVVVTLAAILLTIAVPSFNDLIVSQRVKTAAFSFTGAAVFARSEAIKRNTDVVMTANTGGWQNGWSITAATGATAPLGRQEAFPGVEFATSSTASTQVLYQASGRLPTPVNASDPLPTVQISGSAASHARCISFDLSGLPKSRMGAC